MHRSADPQNRTGRPVRRRTSCGSLGVGYRLLAALVEWVGLFLIANLRPYFAQNEHSYMVAVLL